MLLARVRFSRNWAGKSAPPSSLGVPLPQYTQMRVLLATSLSTLTVGSLRAQAGSPAGPHIGPGSKPPESCIANPTKVGQTPSDRFKKPDSEPAYRKFCGCHSARVNAALPPMERPTMALPLGLMPRFAANHGGSSCVRKVSHLYVQVSPLPTAGAYQSV